MHVGNTLVDRFRDISLWQTQVLTELLDDDHKKITLPTCVGLVIQRSYPLHTVIYVE